MMMETGDAKDRLVEKPAETADPALKKKLRQIFALYNCAKQKEYREILKKYALDFYHLAHSHPIFYEKSSLLVSLIKELIVGDPELEQKMAQTLKENMTAYSERKEVSFIKQVVLPILHAEPEVALTFSLKQGDSVVPVYSNNSTKDSKSNFFLKTDLLNDKQKDTFAKTFNTLQEGPNEAFQQLMGSKWEKIF